MVSNYPGAVIWFTGLSGAGKSTLGQMLADELRARALPVELLDGDEVRMRLSPALGFSKEDRDINIRRIGYVANLLARNGVFVVTAAISPYADTRGEVRSWINEFVEVHVDCPLDELIRRDVKGLYKRALAGEIQHFTGVSDPYEEPLNPELRLDSSAEVPEQSLRRVLEHLESQEIVPKATLASVAGAGTAVTDA